MSIGEPPTGPLTRPGGTTQGSTANRYVVLVLSDLRIATADPALSAAVVSRVPLLYSAGPDAGLDRPAHVRSASGLTWVPGGLAIIQDDANFLALVDPVGKRVRAITLPAGEAGLRLFDDVRGNKRFRLDLEACLTVETPEGPILLAFGSGSSKRREEVLIVNRWELDTPRAMRVHVPRLYGALRDEAKFSGSELNIEGAVQIGDRVRLFSRGNGAPRDGRLPVDATCELPLPALLEHLGDGRFPPPTPVDVVQYRLGSMEHVALGFTDAAVWGDAVLYSATAEASPDATRDGPVTGSAIGIIDPAGQARWAPLTSGAGVPLPMKVEGMVVAPGPGLTLYAVLDADDPAAASELCSVNLVGPWAGS